MQEEYPDLQVSGSVLRAHATDALVDAAEEAGLLVLGTRGHGSLAGAILGSTSLGVLSRATTAIMIVE